MEMRKKSILSGLESGQHNVVISDAQRELPPGRLFAPLSRARGIQAPGCYWVSASGVPTEAGHYMDNGDGTFTKLANWSEARWSERLYVSKEAAAKASSGDGPILLIVWIAPFGEGRLCLDSCNWFMKARVAHVSEREVLLAQEEYGIKMPGIRKD